MKRREVIKVAVGSAILALIPASKALEKIRAKGKKHLVMVIDLNRCNGCKACTVSCGVENGNKPGEHRTEVMQKEITIGDKSYAINLPMLCNQCEEPSCVKVCPTRATYKRNEDGIVVIDSTVCIGCNYCIQACPYDGVRFENHTTSTVDKCNFCIQRTSKGLLPACVETCIGEARTFGDVNDKNSVVSKLLNKNDALVLESKEGTHPNVFYIGLSQNEADERHSLRDNLQWQR